MKCGNVYVHYIPDVGENQGGFYCMVYEDENLENEIDQFCITPEDCDCTNEKVVENYIRNYLKKI